MSLPTHTEPMKGGYVYIMTNGVSGTLYVGVTADLLNGDFFIPGQLFVVTFNTCGPAPTAADFACVVQSASDTAGAAVLAGVTCSVSVP